MSLPAITTPVSRHLDVADLTRSIAFYRDVVGFDVHRDASTGDGSVALTLGPARITLGTQAPSIDRAERNIVFFGIDDVDAMHDLLRSRGATTSTVENVNWIKMRMVEVRDPDNNTLWFGKTFGGPNAPITQRMLRTVMPELPLSNVPAGIAHYRDVLGFSINYQQDDLGVMDRDGMRLLLIARTDGHTGIGSCCFYVTDADALHAELLAKGAKVQGEPVSYPWGLREFKVLDGEGNRLSFAQTFE
jgi:predicted enzyme related to lactoylglutathione lyase